MENEKNNVLKVKMFGDFTAEYNGESILGKKTSGTQFLYLIQLLLHNNEQGVAREDLEDAVFGDREIDNKHHAMQSIIYNAKKKLKETSLPDVNYIRLEKNVFYWTSEIAVEKDTELFEVYYEKSKKTDIEDKKIDYLFRAINLYQGEFLQQYTSVIWVAMEAKRYHDMFCSCVEELSQMLKKRADYPRMEKLGNYAAKVMPFSDWEAITMEALIGQNQYEQASDYYSRTVDRYFEERGLRPSIKMVEALDRLGEQIIHPVEVLDDIQSKLNDMEETGGYGCSYPVFRGVYQVVTRMMERSGMSLYLMLCSIVDSKGNMMRDGEQLDELSARLGEAIKKSIRKSDVYNRYSKGQYLVLLFNTTRENCSVVQKRINYNFLTGRQRTGVQYYVNSVYTEQLPE